MICGFALVPVCVDILCETESPPIYKSITCKSVKCNYSNVHRTLMKKIHSVLHFYSIIKSELNMCIGFNPTLKLYFFLWLKKGIKCTKRAYRQLVKGTQVENNVNVQNTRCSGSCLYTKNNTTSVNPINNAKSYIINNSVQNSFLRIYTCFSAKRIWAYTVPVQCALVSSCVFPALLLLASGARLTSSSSAYVRLSSATRGFRRGRSERKSRAFQCGKRLLYAVKV